ncbi:C40 family peptidase [Leptospira paudalimensis]|uniref:Lecithin retinol acyltransferase family protein n=1 Tax=Leptospira paudalimensis TaxID=2950024 RepID=A0ABT3M669_9LEPT|nr:hypothetical protein [Leptospira paudalimensis]MCW7503892.1 lecithin retinol acyltransferase family protein [Leptospira paudalimensis]
MNIDWHIGWEISRAKEFGFRHTGVVYGKDIFGNILILHNHQRNNVEIVTLNEFLGGEQIFQIRKPSLPIREVIQNMKLALNETKRYNLTTFNCQHFSSSIVDGFESSSAVKGLLTIAAFAGITYFMNKLNLTS